MEVMRKDMSGNGSSMWSIWHPSDRSGTSPLKNKVQELVYLLLRSKEIIHTANKQLHPVSEWHIIGRSAGNCCSKKHRVPFDSTVRREWGPRTQMEPSTRLHGLLYHLGLSIWAKMFFEWLVIIKTHGESLGTQLSEGTLSSTTICSLSAAVCNSNSNSNPNLDILELKWRRLIPLST